MTIEESAFNGCTGLKTATVLAPVKKLVLNDTNALETLTLGTDINKLEINSTSLKEHQRSRQEGRLLQATSARGTAPPHCGVACGEEGEEEIVPFNLSRWRQ